MIDPFEKRFSIIILYVILYVLILSSLIFYINTLLLQSTINAKNIKFILKNNFHYKKSTYAFTLQIKEDVRLT